MPRPRTKSEWEVVLTKYYSKYDLDALAKEYKVSKQAILDRAKLMDHRRKAFESQHRYFPDFE